MTINIQSSEADKLVKELSKLTGESITEIVVKSLAQRLEREKSQNNASTSLERELLAISQSYQDLPTLDDRSEEEILGSD